MCCATNVYSPAIFSCSVLQSLVISAAFDPISAFLPASAVKNCEYQCPICSHDLNDVISTAWRVANPSFPPSSLASPLPPGGLLASFAGGKFECFHK